ncbi:MAG: hypothetical protein AB1295_06215 [Candidatus Micrarchaeota archaeon]
MRLRSLFLPLLLLQLSFAAGCVQGVFDNLLSGDPGLMIGLALTLTILGIALLYMAGSITSNAEMIVIAKDELFHLLFSVFLVMSVGGIMLFSCQVLSGFLDFTLGPDGLDLMSPEGCYTGVESPMSVSRCYLSDVKETTEASARKMLQESIRHEMESTLIVSVYNPFTGGVSIPLGAYHKAYAMQFDLTAMNFALPALVSLSLQSLVLSFSADIIRWLLPVALLLRVIPPTRYFGNMLIAITIALYVIVPTLYALNGAMDQVVFSQCGSYSAVVDDPLMGGCDSDTSFWMMARATPQAFFLPNLSLALTITFLGSIAKALKVLG